MPLIYTNRHEQSDFATMLRRHGLSIDDFELSDTPPQIDAPPERVGANFNTIVVKSRRNGVARSYTSGGLTSTWVDDVERDIVQGVFG